MKIKGGRKKNSSDISVSEEAADDSEGAESNSKNSNIVNGIPNAENEITDETQERLSKYEKQYQSLEMRYASLKEKYTDIEDYSSWQEDTIPANKITLVNNGTHAGPKTPLVLQTIRYLAQNADNVTIQTPYVICNGYMYDTLNEIASHAQLKIILNAVEKGSNPWGCTDYLNQKKKILNTGADVYELMNEVPVHTKAVLLDDRLSIVGSYNLDMRSTYLDTELMLVIDSKELNQQIQSTEGTYIEKSKEVLSNGQETEGVQYETKVLNWQKKLFYGVLRIIIRPLRQLLLSIIFLEVKTVKYSKEVTIVMKKTIQEKGLKGRNCHIKTIIVRLKSVNIFTCCSLNPHKTTQVFPAIVKKRKEKGKKPVKNQINSKLGIDFFYKSS